MRDDVEVDGQAGGRVAARGWIAKGAQDVARAVVERIERLLHRHPRVEEKAIRYGGTRDEPNDDGGDEGEADSQMQRFGLAGGRDHVRRGRFASGERRRQRVAARQRGGDRKSGWRSFVRLRAQAAHHCQFDLGIQRLHHGRRRRDAGLLALLDQLREVLAFERALAREELVEEQPERIDVAARRDLVTSELLWRHVGGRAGANRFARRASEAEVGDSDLARAVEHHVGGLEVAMDHAALVRGGEARADLPRDLERSSFREAADAAQERRQIFAVDVFHRQERRSLDLVDVVDAAHIGVRHLPCQPDLGVELCQPRRVLVDVRRQKLERDRLAELQVVGAIDLAHAAAAEASNDAVASAEYGARLEASVVDRARRGEPARRRRPRVSRVAIP